MCRLDSRRLVHRHLRSGNSLVLFLLSVGVLSYRSYVGGRTQRRKRGSTCAAQEEAGNVELQTLILIGIWLLYEHGNEETTQWP